MLAGAAVYVVGLGVMAAAGGATALFVSGALIGVALSCTASSLALTAAARAVPEQQRSKMLGVVSAAGSLGTLLVPLMTQSLLNHHAWQIGALFFVALAVAMLPAGFLAGGADRMPARGGGRTTMRAVLGRSSKAPPVSGDVGRLSRLRAEPRLFDDPFADLSGDLRPGPDAERRGDRGDRRR